MRLYSDTTKSLIDDSTYNRIATNLKDAFFNEFRYQPSVAEVNSWNNSLREKQKRGHYTRGSFFLATDKNLRGQFRSSLSPIPLWR